MIHQKHGTTQYFTLSNKLKSQHEEVNEANEIGNHVEELEQDESVYTFDFITKKHRNCLDIMI